MTDPVVVSIPERDSGKFRDVNAALAQMAEMFQSLKGIRVNFGSSIPPVAKTASRLVSIPERDSGKFRVSQTRQMVGFNQVSIPERDSGKFREDEGYNPEFPSPDPFQSLKGIRVNFGLQQMSRQKW